MHLADGIVTDPQLIAGVSLIGAGALGVALSRVVQDRAARVAWTGSLAAFVLAAQAINIPLVPGASAHAIGAALLAITVGPAQAIVALCAVVTVQALLLADGGIVVLGVNMLNIAVLPVLAIHGIQRLLGKRVLATAVIGATLGNLFGAASLTALLVAGAGAPAKITVLWLLSVQGIAGVIEGTLTGLALQRLAATQGDLAAASGPGPGYSASPKAAAGWVAIAFGIALVLLPLSSSVPDALERVVAELSGEPRQ